MLVCAEEGKSEVHGQTQTNRYIAGMQLVVCEMPYLVLTYFFSTGIEIPLTAQLSLYISNWSGLL